MAKCTFSTALQALGSYFHCFRDLGNSGDGGMPGTSTPASTVKIFNKIREVVGHDTPYEMVDIGAGNGVMCLSALCFGATFSVGIELITAQVSVYRKSLSILESYGVPASRTSVSYGVDVNSYSHLPTLQLEGMPAIPKAVFFFCDGLPEQARMHTFCLVRQDTDVHVFLCSLGKGKEDRFSCTADILHVLNDKCDRHFKFHSSFVVSMKGSQAKKTVCVFSKRTVPLRL